jgi:hypothetical protein
MGIMYSAGACNDTRTPTLPVAYLGSLTRDSRYVNDTELCNFRAGRSYGLVNCRELARQLCAGQYRVRIGPRLGVYRERNIAPAFVANDTERILACQVRTRRTQAWV